MNNDDGIWYSPKRIENEAELEKIIDQFGITEAGDISAIYDGPIPPQHRPQEQKPVHRQQTLMPVKQEMQPAITPKPLSHIERKMLSIIRNYKISHKCAPPMLLLRAKTGRNEAGVKEAIQGLVDKGYARWGVKDSVEHVILIKEWPDDAESPQRSNNNQGRPWYEYLTDPSSPWS